MLYSYCMGEWAGLVSALFFLRSSGSGAILPGRAHFTLGSRFLTVAIKAGGVR
jgi:hypothetical protein